MSTPATTGAARPPWLPCVLFGLATIGFAVWFTNVVPAETCAGPLPPGVSALVAFQLARTPDAVESVFGAAGSACREAMTAALERANRVDLAGFIATYAAFLGCFLLAMTRAGGGLAARWGLAALAAGVAFDALETATQLRITRDLPGTAGMLATLAIASRGKFAALALVGLCAGVAMAVRGGVAGRLAGVACAAGATLALLGVAHPPARGLLALGNAVAWTIMLLYAGAAALSRYLSGSARSPRPA